MIFSETVRDVFDVSSEKAVKKQAQGQGDGRRCGAAVKAHENGEKALEKADRPHCSGGRKK